MLANHRIARYYSLYSQNNSLIVNNTIFNFMVIPFTAIESIQINNKFNADSVDNSIKIGRAKQHNIIMNFNSSITYWGMSGMFVEQVKHILLNVKNPHEFVTKLEEEIAIKR